MHASEPWQFCRLPCRFLRQCSITTSKPAESCTFCDRTSDVAIVFLLLMDPHNLRQLDDAKLTTKTPSTTQKTNIDCISPKTRIFMSIIQVAIAPNRVLLFMSTVGHSRVQLSKYPLYLSPLPVIVPYRSGPEICVLYMQSSQP